VEVLSIRKENWYNLLCDYPELGSILISEVYLEYITGIRMKVMVFKNKAKANMKDRLDYNMVQRNEENRIKIAEMITDAKENIGYF